MSYITNRRELKNCRMYLVPAGTVLALGNGGSSLTVAESAVFPDNDPTTNYTDYELPEIEAVTEEVKKKDEEFMIPDVVGGAYFSDEETTITARKWKGTSHKTTALLKMLQHGLAAKPAIGTAAALGANKDPYVDGVFLLEVASKGGTIIERAVCWARLRLTSGGGIGPDTAKVEFEVTMRPNVYNSFLQVA